MKRSNITTIIFVNAAALFFMTGIALSQTWTAGTEIIYVNPSTTKVGIGTTAPAYPLDVQSSNTRLVVNIGSTTQTRYSDLRLISNTGNARIWKSGDSYTDYGGARALNIYNSENYPIAFYQGTSERMRINSGGNVGIGTTYPYEKFTVSSSSANDGGATRIRINNLASDVSSRVNLVSGNIDTDEPYFAIETRENTSPNNIIERLRIDHNGNVGIGTTTPDYKMDVKGIIRAEEVKVETGWSDFVFEEDYALPSLTQVESYIEEYNHLPGIPSAEEIKENGLSIAEMMAKQMQKIEELTLYLIELKEENEELKNKNDEFEKRFAVLENQK